MTMLVAIGLLIALAAWWLLTGVVLWGSRGGPIRQRLSLAIWTTILIAGLSVHAEASQAVTPEASLLAFLSVLGVWAWQEIAFLTGAVTGPNRARATPDLRGWRRFWKAFLTVSHHRLRWCCFLLRLPSPQFRLPTRRVWRPSLCSG